MHNATQTARRRKAWALASFLALTFVLVLLFTLAETGHACTGVDCSVCLQLRRLQALLHLVGAALAVLIATAVRLPPLRSAQQPRAPLALRATPVDLRTRLND